MIDFIITISQVYLYCDDIYSDECQSRNAELDHRENGHLAAAVLAAVHYCSKSLDSVPRGKFPLRRSLQQPASELFGISGRKCILPLRLRQYQQMRRWLIANLSSEKILLLFFLTFSKI